MGKATTRALARQELRRIRDANTRIAGHILTLQKLLAMQVDDVLDQSLVKLEEMLTLQDELVEAIYKRL